MIASEDQDKLFECIETSFGISELLFQATIGNSEYKDIHGAAWALNNAMRDARLILKRDEK